MLNPSDIVNDVKHIMMAEGNRGKGSTNLPATAYQWLERLGTLEVDNNPDGRNLRDILIKQRGIPGKGSGSFYSAAQVVSDALEKLARDEEVEITYHDCVGELFMVAGQTITPGYSVCARYRLL